MGSVHTYVCRQLDLSSNYSNIIICFHFVLTYVSTYVLYSLTQLVHMCVCVYVRMCLHCLSGEPCLPLLQGFECMVDLLNLQSEREDDPSAAKALLDASKSLTRASLNVIEGAKVCGW